MLPALVLRRARNLSSWSQLLHASVWHQPRDDAHGEVVLSRADQPLGFSTSTRKTQTECFHRRMDLSVAWMHRGFASDAQPEPQGKGEPQGEASTAGPKHAPLSQDVYYKGPLAETHKMLKRISIANTIIALAAAPAIIAWADVSYTSRVGLATTLVMFGIMTTGALHWITRPYVHELKYTAATQDIEVKTSTMLGRTRTEHFSLSDVKPLPWNRPVATFTAKDHFYYIDIYSFPDEDLLKKLHPEDVPEGYKDDKDDD